VGLLLLDTAQSSKVWASNVVYGGDGQQMVILYLDILGLSVYWIPSKHIWKFGIDISDMFVGDPINNWMIYHDLPLKSSSGSVLLKQLVGQ